MFKTSASIWAVLIVVTAAAAVVEVIGVSQPYVSISGKSNKTSLTINNQSVSFECRIGAGLLGGTLSVDSKGAVEGCWAPGYGFSLGKQQKTPALAYAQLTVCCASTKGFKTKLEFNANVHIGKLGGGVSVNLKPMVKTLVQFKAIPYQIVHEQCNKTGVYNPYSCEQAYKQFIRPR